MSTLRAARRAAAAEGIGELECLRIKGPLATIPATTVPPPTSVAANNGEESGSSPDIPGAIAAVEVAVVSVVVVVVADAAADAADATAVCGRHVTVPTPGLPLPADAIAFKVVVRSILASLPMLALAMLPLTITPGN